MLGENVIDSIGPHSFECGKVERVKIHTPISEVQEYAFKDAKLLETVEMDTPASLATSFIVTRLLSSFANVFPYQSMVQHTTCASSCGEIV